MSDLSVRPQDLGIGRLFEKVRDAVIVAEGTTGRIVLWNQRATQIFGYSPSEALELRVEALVPERCGSGTARVCSATGRRDMDSTSTPAGCWSCPPCARGVRRSASS
jgi:PAS domain-containing protein